MHVTTSPDMFVQYGRPIYKQNDYTFTFLLCSMQRVLLSLHTIDDFRMIGLLHRTVFVNEQETM